MLRDLEIGLTHRDNNFHLKIFPSGPLMRAVRCRTLKERRERKTQEPSKRLHNTTRRRLYRTPHSELSDSLCEREAGGESQGGREEQ